MPKTPKLKQHKINLHPYKTNDDRRVERAKIGISTSDQDSLAAEKSVGGETHASTSTSTSKAMKQKEKAMKWKDLVESKAVAAAGSVAAAVAHKKRRRKAGTRMEEDREMLSELEASLVSAANETDQNAIKPSVMATSNKLKQQIAVREAARYLFCTTDGSILFT